MKQQMPPKSTNGKKKYEDRCLITYYANPKMAKESFQAISTATQTRSKSEVEAQCWYFKIQTEQIIL